MSNQKFPVSGAYPSSVFNLIWSALENGYARECFVAGPRQLFEIDEGGVRVKPNPAGGARVWHPQSELWSEGDTDNPYDKYWLPFPFTAEQLAAFMVDGCGEMFLRAEFGEWENGPNAGEDHPTHRLTAVARQAMSSAYAAYRKAARIADQEWSDMIRQAEAEHAIASSDLQKWKRRHKRDLASPEHVARYERERKLSSKVSELRNQWRRTVVRQLLGAETAATCSNEADEESPKGQPRVDWRLGLAALLPAIQQETGKSDVMTVIRELKVRGGDWGIGKDGPPGELRWRDNQSTDHSLDKKTVSNALAQTRKLLKSRGVLPG